MTDNLIYLPSKIDKSKLNEVLIKVYTQYQNKKIELDGVTISIKALPDEIRPQIKLEGKKIMGKLPICFTLFKNAGLFSMEGEGIIIIDVEVEIDIFQNFDFQTKTSWISHEWFKGPTVHVGELSIPAETISNCVINFLKEDITTKIDQQIAETIHLKDIVELKLSQFATNIKIHTNPDIYFNGSVNHIFLGHPKDSQDAIEIDIWVELLAKISDEPVNYQFESQLNFFWAEFAPQANQQTLEAEFSYIGLSKYLTSIIDGNEIGGKKFEVEGIHIRNTQNLEIKVHLTAPIKGILTILCNPKFNVESQNLYLDDLQIDVNAENIIYKMASPIIENIVKSKIESQLPYNPTAPIKAILNKLPNINLLDNQIKLSPSFEHPKIESIMLGQNTVQCQISVQNPEVNIELN
jgi:hypothetical protein